MNISYLLLHQPYGRGSGRYLRYLMDYFKKYNKVNLICGMKIKPYLKVKVNTPKIPFQLPVYHGRTDVKKNIKLSKISDKQFFRLIEIFNKEIMKSNNYNKIDIIHVNHCSILPYSCNFTKAKTNIPYIITAHGTGIMSSLESDRNKEIAQTGIDGCDLIIANSDFTKKQVKHNFNIKPSKIKTVYLGINPNEFKPLAKNEINKVKKKYNSLNKKLVFSNGFMDKDKGFQDVVRAAKVYDKKGITTIISGIGPYYKNIKAMIKKLNLKNTKLIGWLPKQELLNLYAACDLHVFPSRWGEPFGLVAVEAMASGTPVIGTNVGGIPEIIKNNGVLIEPKNPDKMAKAIMDNIFDDMWLEKNSKKARDIVKSKFNYIRMCKETEKIYRKVTNK